MHVGQQVFIAAVLIAFFGIVSTQTYYATFGVKYYFLDIPIQHIIFRAVALIKYDATLALPYLALAFVLALDESQIPIKIGSFRVASKSYCYPILVAILVWGWFLSGDAGIRLAIDQMDPKATSLRQLSSFDSDNVDKKTDVAKLLSDDNIVLILVRTKSELIVFSAPCFRSERPQLRLIHIRLSENDRFEHTPNVRGSPQRPGCPKVATP